MFAHLTIEQPCNESPFGKPFGVTRDGASVEWFCEESEAWDYRDQLLDDGFRGVRVIGAPCRGTVANPSVADAKYGCSGFCDGD